MISRSLHIALMALIYLITPIVLPACSVVTDTVIVLPGTKENFASEYLLKAPVNRYRDKFFETDLGDYKVTNLNISRRSSGEKKLVDVGPRDSLLLNGIFFGEWQSSRTALYSFSRERTFKFNLLDHSNTTVIHASCRYVSRQSKEQEISKFGFGKTKDNRRSGDEEKWLSSAMQCDLKQEQYNFSLNLLSEKDKEISVELISDYSRYDLKRPDQYKKIMKTSDGKTRTYQIQQTSVVEALRITHAGKDVGSITFTSPIQRISVSKSLPENTKQVLLAAGYGLVISSWLDRHWLGRT